MPTTRRSAKKAVPPPDVGQRDDDDMSEQDVWRIIEAYFAKYGLVRHQNEAYDNFILFLIPHIIQESVNIRIPHEARDEEHVISICNVGMNLPTITEADGTQRDLMPHMARLRGITYACNVVVDVTHDIFRKESHVDRRIYREVLLCSLPVMVGSKCCHTHTKSSGNECRLDQGGYFIISGIEKTLIAQERLRTNVPFVFATRSHSKYRYCCEIRSCHQDKLRSTSTLTMYMTNTKRGAMPEMVAFLPFMQQMPIPVLALFRLLRVSTRAEVVRLIIGDGDVPEMRLLCSVLDNDTTADMNTADLFDWLGREATVETTKERRQRYLDHIVSNEMLPHMGLTNEPEVLAAKAAYLGYMVRKLIKVYSGDFQADDRDHYSGKRIDANGMGMLFRQLYRGVLKTATAQMLRLRDQDKLRFTNVATLFNTRRITNSFRYAFSTGTWSMQNTKSVSSAQTGVVQMISRMSVIASISNMRRINTPISRETKAPQPRQLHYTSWGIVCPVETPEGASCGLIKNLSMMAHVRVGTHSGPVNECLKMTCSDLMLLLPEMTDRVRASGYPVLVNGCLQAYAFDYEGAMLIVTRLRAARRTMSIPFDTTVALSDMTVVIDSDAGCLMRPLFVGANMHRAREVLRTCPSVYQVWTELLRANVIEYIDKQEENMLRVGMWCTAPEPDKYTHYEMHPSLMLGLCAAMIPFPDHNQAPRNTYQSAMCKQSMGMFAFTHARRMDTVTHVLCDPERPLVSTRLDSILQISDAPSGVNVIVCIMVCGGYNQEDSVILNRSAVERGLFASVKYCTHRDEERANGADSERFENPAALSACQGMRIGNYDKLDAEGFAAVGQVVSSGDVIIGKTVTTNSADAIVKGQRKIVKHDKSTILKHDASVVDSLFLSTKPDGSRIVKIKTRSTRQPMVGDKFSSRMGQKGVVGRMLPQEDMPYTEDGIVPDLIFNPHAIPSRMTLGQMMECLLGKLAAIKGELGDATPFCGVTVDAISDALEGEGYDGLGNETMRDGRTGRVYESKVFIGPTYYQRLKHMAADKAHARSRGPKQVLTHQPLEGRAREGGLRFGEMERDCLDEKTHQILTSEGFLFLHELERRRDSGEEILVGAFDPTADTLVYEPMTELVVNDARERAWIHMQSPAEATRWNGKGTRFRHHSNQVSLAVTEKHIMYAQQGEARARRDGGTDYVVWSEEGVAEKGTPFSECTAGDMHAAGANAAFRLRTAPANGLASTTTPMDILAPLGVNDPRTLNVFLEVYGYWLGDGSLQFKAGCGTDAVVFTIVKEDDVAFLVEALAHLTEDVRMYGQDAYQKRIVVTDPHWITFFHGTYRSKYVLGDVNASRPSTLAKRAKKDTAAKSPIGVKSAKWFAPFVWTLPRDAARVLLQGLQRADGCRKTRVPKIFTSSTTFRDEIVHLCLHAGYAPRFTYLAGSERGTSRTGHAIVARRDGWQVTFADATKRSAYGQPVVRTAEMQRVVEHGRSWCVAVPHGFVITRRAIANDDGVITQASVPIVVHNCLISHGADRFLQERLMLTSDAFDVFVCDKCGNFASPPSTHSIVAHTRPHCRVCESHQHVRKTCIPYACKLLLQELSGMHVGVRLLKDKCTK